jgi:hypothetical protein
MTFGGSQLAHLKVASLIKSMNLRCAFPFDQGRIPIVMQDVVYRGPIVPTYIWAEPGIDHVTLIHRIWLS